MKIRGLNNDPSQGMHPLMKLGHMFLAAIPIEEFP
jgi:hypothetical protein